MSRPASLEEFATHEAPRTLAVAAQMAGTMAVAACFVEEYGQMDVLSLVDQDDYGYFEDDLLLNRDVTLAVAPSGATSSTYRNSLRFIHEAALYARSVAVNQNYKMLSPEKATRPILKKGRELKLGFFTCAEAVGEVLRFADNSLEYRELSLENTEAVMTIPVFRRTRFVVYPTASDARMYGGTAAPESIHVGWRQAARLRSNKEPVHIYQPHLGQ